MSEIKPATAPGASADEIEIQKAKELIKTEAEARAKKCWQQVQDTLKAHNCTLHFGMEIQGQVVPLQSILVGGVVLNVVPQ